MKSGGVVFYAIIFLLLFFNGNAQADVVDGLISFGRTIGDATKSVVNTFKEWGDRVNKPKSVKVKGEEINPFFTRVCGHGPKEQKELISCLEKDEQYLLHSAWNKCIGRARHEVQVFAELMHWFCAVLNSDSLSGMTRIQSCILEDVDESYAMTLYRLCARRL